jgi:hypothetical protein
VGYFFYIDREFVTVRLDMVRYGALNNSDN